MHRHSAFSSTQKAFTGLMASALICLAACGSDSKKTTTGGASTDSNTTVAADTSVVNSDKTGQEPVVTPQSPAVKTTINGVDTSMPYVEFSYNANATVPAKANRLVAFTYDNCVFSANHGYTTFPSGAFDFVGFYLVNGTPGAPLAMGTYTAGATSGMYIDTADSGAGYNVTKCKASGYPTVKSGTITVSALGTGTSSVLGFAGDLNVTMTDGSVFSGAFSTGTCVGGNGSTPNPPANDPYACASIN